MRLAPAFAAAAIVSVLGGSAWAASSRPAISPATASTPPISDYAHVTPADLDKINAQIRTDEDRLSQRRDALQARGNGIVVGTRVALNYNPYPHPRMGRFARWFGWRKPKQH